MTRSDLVTLLAERFTQLTHRDAEPHTVPNPLADSGANDDTESFADSSDNCIAVSDAVADAVSNADTFACGRTDSVASTDSNAGTVPHRAFLSRGARRVDRSEVDDRRCGHRSPWRVGGAAARCAGRRRWGCRALHLRHADCVDDAAR